MPAFVDYERNKKLISDSLSAAMYACHAMENFSMKKRRCIHIHLRLAHLMKMKSQYDFYVYLYYA